MKIALLLLGLSMAAASAHALQVGDTFGVFSQRQTPGAGMGIGYVYTYIKSPSGVVHYDNEFRPYAGRDGYHTTDVPLDEAGVWTHYTASASTGTSRDKPDGVDRESTFTVDPKPQPPPPPSKPEVVVRGPSGTVSISRGR